MIWPELTEADLRAARAFRQAQRELLAAQPPADITVSVFVRQVRHACAKLDGRSVNLELREHYVLSPAYVLFTDGQIRETQRTDLDFAQEVLDDLDAAGMRHLSIAEAIIPGGRFGFIFTEGRCQACGMTARSGDSRLVDPRLRSPASRAAVTGQADYAVLPILAA